MKLSVDTKPKAKSKSNSIVGTVVLRSLIMLLILLVCIILFLFCAMGVIFKGPSPTARDIVTITLMETSFGKLFPPLFLSDKEINEIQEKNAIVTTNEITKTDNDFTKPVDNTNTTQPDIEIKDVIGSTYKGKMMIVKDPSKVIVSSPDEFGKEAEGIKLDKLIEKEKAIAGINAGGFFDENGVGKGGMPLGIVIRNSKLIFGSPETSSVILGFDEKNVFLVGKMTAKEAMEKKMRDAVSFGPPLVINSKPVESIGNGGGLNPRTAIGQRADGSVLLLVIDGRQPQSLGATYKDLVDVMVEYEAINAGNLDGGSSTMLYYQGELQNVCASLYGPRRIPTAFVVKE